MTSRAPPKSSRTSLRLYAPDGDPFDAVGRRQPRDECVERFGVRRSGRQGQFERVGQRILVEHRLEFVGEQLPEGFVFGLLLLGREDDRADELLLRERFADGGAALVRQLPAQLHAHGDALAERAGRLHRHGQQMAHRAQQEEYERHADGRYDVRVPYLAFESFIVFHVRTQCVFRDGGAFRPPGRAGLRRRTSPQAATGRRMPRLSVFSICGGHRPPPQRRPPE